MFQLLDSICSTHYVAHTQHSVYCISVVNKMGMRLEVSYIWLEGLTPAKNEKVYSPHVSALKFIGLKQLVYLSRLTNILLKV